MAQNGWETTKRVVDLLASVAVIATMWFIALQWLEMRSGSVDTHDLAVAAKAQAEAAKSQADNTKVVAESAKSQAANTEKLATAASNQAKAAIEAAATAKSAMNLSVQSFHVSERPYITIENMRFEPAFDPKASSVHIKLELHNAGRTPALKVIHHFHSLLDGKETGESPGTSEVTVASDRNAVLDMSTAFTGDIGGIGDGTRALFFKGDIVYRDIFKERHTTTVCGVYDAKTKQWVYCPGNDVR
jgi:hypothetical protein